MVSVSLCLLLLDPCRNPLQRPLPAPSWELSCGLALPTVPPWRLTHKRSRRFHHHYGLLLREQRRSRNFPPKIIPSTRPTSYLWEFNDPLLWDFDDDDPHESPTVSPGFDSKFADDLFKRLHPLDYFLHLRALHDDSLLTTVKQKEIAQAAMVAATELRATYKVSDLKWSPELPSRQFVLHTTDPSCVPVVIDTGASVNLTPFASDFVGPIQPPDLKSLQGLGSSSDVVGQGLVEWQIRDVFGNVKTIRTTAYLVPTAPVRLMSPQTYFREGESGELRVDHLKAEVTLHDGSVLTFPFAENMLPYMLPDWQPVVGVTFQDHSVLCDQPLIHMSVADETNQNLTAAQKELLKWHWKLGHGHFGWIQRLASTRNRRSILETKHSLSTVPLPYCAPCSLAKLKRRMPPGTVGGEPPPEMQIRAGDLQPGDCVSVDQYVSAVPGRLPNTEGKELPKDKYHGGTIFVDHASSYIFLVNQISLRAGETLQSKLAFERFAHNCGHKLKSFRADNMPFNSQEFKTDLEAKNQELTLSGVGAHHQNGVAERSIQTVTQWARAMLLHLALHWPEQSRLDLWPFALEHAVYLWNHMPKKDSLLAPVELFTGAVFDDYHHLQHSHVWGCPTYVLDPKLQDGKKIPKWDPRSRRGMFVGVSPSHSSTIGRILNLRTGRISPQYHVVYDDLFSTVPNAETGGVENNMPFNSDSWSKIVETGLEKYLDPVEEASSGTAPEGESEDIVSQNADVPTVHENPPSLSEGDLSQPAPAPPDPAPPDPAPPSSRYWDAPLPAKRKSKPNPRYADHVHNYPAQLESRKFKLKSLNESVLMALDWSKNQVLQTASNYSKMMALFQLATDPFTNEVDGELHPCLLTSKASQADNPTYEEAMNGPHRDGFFDAMKTELKTLTDMACWEVVERLPSMNVLPSTWAFKLKRYPDGSVRKYKARFCAGGHRQIEGVDFFETFAPVVNWTTVRLLLILSQVLGLASQQVDYTAAFVHAPIEEEVYVQMPRGNLESCGFRNPSPDTDPCLFVSDKVVCVVYVDDTLLWSPKSEWIEEAVSQLTATGMTLEVEESVAGFLGVHIERNQTDGSIKLTQKGLIKRIISALGIEHEPAVHTPATSIPLTKDLDGDPPDGSFNYASVIGMLGYLQANSRPDITFAVSAAARFTHSPRRSHEEALKRIGRYLQGTLDEGLVLRPSETLNIDCYVDADFAGLWPHEDKADPTCVKSRTGFAICVANCPVIWSSKLQGDIATSTMEAEYSIGNA
ncbi:reverse transcriptase RNA-dependent DNA polymerase [Nitzschia inconspicua]|uniref:Reverse transcriptase RNA-dependent DNA polymerase n=1 Tax=Nitzschia inconspicua TaxID=303405 RepID=A0A9K3PJH9_9STRA|nr:reverse transcriptase RNA-dependent DNA polymerase [Nitzschia inconspicua]